MITIIILHHLNLHMPELCGKICPYMRHMQHICHIYVPHILPNSAYFFTYFASKSSAYFKKIFRYIRTALKNNDSNSSEFTAFLSQKICIYCDYLLSAVATPGGRTVFLRKAPKHQQKQENKSKLYFDELLLCIIYILTCCMWQIRRRTMTAV